MVIAGDTILDQKPSLYPGGQYFFGQKFLFGLQVDPQNLIPDRPTITKKSLHANPNITKTKLEKLLRAYIADSLSFENVQVTINNAPKNFIGFVPQTIKIDKGSFKSITFRIDPEIQEKLLEALVNHEENSFLEELDELMEMLAEDVESLKAALPGDLQEILDRSLEKISNSAVYKSTNCTGIKHEDIPLYEYLRFLHDLKVQCDNDDEGALIGVNSSSNSLGFTIPTFAIEDPYAKILEKRDEVMNLIGRTLVEELEDRLGFDIENDLGCRAVNWNKLPDVDADTLFNSLLYIQKQFQSAI